MTTVTNASIASFFPMGVTSKPNFLLCRRRTAERVVTTDSWFLSGWWLGEEIAWALVLTPPGQATSPIRASRTSTRTIRRQ